MLRKTGSYLHISKQNSKRTNKGIDEKNAEM